MTKQASVRAWNMDDPLLHFSDQDHCTLRKVFEGVAGFGATGSGKTTGPAQAFALAFLLAGFGCLVLMAKRTDRADWINYCRRAGRLQDLRIFAPDQPWRFNFLNYEFGHGGRGAGVTDNLADLLQQIQEVRDRRRVNGESAFWRDSQRGLLCACIDLIAAAGEVISLPLMYDLITSIPQSVEQASSPEWLKNSTNAQLLHKAAANRNLTRRQEEDVALAMKYFLRELPGLAADTRSCVVTGLASMMNSFLRGHLRELFCTTTTLTPEDCFEGRIILIDLSVKEFNELGVLAQVLWKLCWQRAVERRDVLANPRPVGLLADEAQLTVSPGDIAFQATARSARAATVLMAQSLASYHAAFGHDKQGEAMTNALLSNLNTKIFCSNDDAGGTNTWAANLIGHSWQRKENFGSSFPTGDGESRGSAGLTDDRRYIVEPVEFQRLHRGGPASGNQVQTIIYRGGEPFRATGRNHIRVAFAQEIE